jgi:hypothetical protein
MAFAHRQVCNKLVLRVAQPLGSSDSAADVPRAAAISRACGRDAGAPAPELVAAACKAGNCKSWLCDFIRQSAAAANKAEMERRMRLASEAAAGWQPVKHKGGRATANAAPAAAPAAAAVPPPSSQGDLLAANRTTCAGAVPLKPPAPPAPLKVPAPPAASPKRAAEPTEAASAASPATGAKQRRLAVDGETGSEVDRAAAVALPSSPDPHGQGSERAMEVEPAAAAATPKVTDKWVQEQAMVLPAVGGWSVPADQPAAIALPTDGATTSAAASLAMLVCDRLGRRLALAGLLDEVGDEDKAAVPGVMTVLAQHGHVRTLDGSGGPAPMETCTHVVFLTAGEAA